MPWVGFEPTISAGERPKTYALDRAATGIGVQKYGTCKIFLQNYIIFELITLSNWALFVKSGSTEVQI